MLTARARIVIYIPFIGRKRQERADALKDWGPYSCWSESQISCYLSESVMPRKVGEIIEPLTFVPVDSSAKRGSWRPSLRPY